MSLAGYQDALARLLVDASLRRRWAAGELDWRDDPDAHRELGVDLDSAERAALASLDPSEVERLARSLLGKRRRAVEGLVPHTARLWTGLGEAYEGLLEQRPARVEDLDPTLGPAASELLRVAPRLVHAAKTDPAAPVWTGDLLRLELARACVRIAGGVRALRCAYPIHELLLACDRGWLGVIVDPGPHAYRVERGALRWRSLGEGTGAGPGAGPG